MSGISLLTVAAFATAFLISWLSTPLVGKMAEKWGFVDIPGGRKKQGHPVPLLGGVAIFAPLFMCLSLTLLIRTHYAEEVFRYNGDQILSLFLATVWMVVLGSFDDFRQLNWKTKMAGELIGVAILVYGGHYIKSASVPVLGHVEFGWLGIPVFAVSVLFITNAINISDGMDGLAAGIAFFACFTGGIIGWLKGDVFVSLASVTLAGGLLGFLRFNFPPASIYMGDGGSLALGLFLGTLAAGQVAIAPGQRSGVLSVLIVPFLPLGLAVMDTCWAMLRRFIGGRGVFLPDSEHVHHLLMAQFRNPRTVLLVLYGLTAALSIMAIVLSAFPRLALSIPNAAFIAFIVLSTSVFLLRLYRLEYLQQSIANRFHAQFLLSFSAFMDRRLQRAQSMEERISLLEGGVRDLGFDRVDVELFGVHVRHWAAKHVVHPGAARLEGKRVLDHSGLTVRWSLPTHDSPLYQRHLDQTWHEFLDTLDRSMTASPGFSASEQALMEMKSPKLA